MVDSSNVGVIEEKKSLLGKQYFKFQNQEFKTREEAEEARRTEIERLKKESEQAEIDRKIEELLNTKRAEYDSDPVYLSMAVECSYTRDIRSGFFSDYDTNLAAYVDLDSLRNKIDYACRELFIRGYDVISITQAISGVGSNTIWGKGTQSAAAAGWGYSFTNGAIITAKKR